MFRALTSLIVDFTIEPVGDLQLRYTKKTKICTPLGQNIYKKENLSLTYRLAYTPFDEDAIYNGTMLSPFSNKVVWILGINAVHEFIPDITSQQIMLTNTVLSSFIPFTFASSYIEYDIGENNEFKNQLTKKVEDMKVFWSINSKYLSFPSINDEND